jgi:hypothetical protein
MGIVIALNAHRPAAVLQAVSVGGALAHPLLSSFAAKLSPDVAKAVNQVVANGIASGTTTAAMARQIVALGFDRRVADGIARTGAAALADDARRRMGW